MHNRENLGAGENTSLLWAYGVIGRRMGLKIPRILFVSVRVRLRLLCSHGGIRKTQQSQTLSRNHAGSNPAGCIRPWVHKYTQCTQKM